MKSYMPNDIKDQNRKIIFDLLLDNPVVAKVEIAEMTTMSLVTVGKIMDYFEEIKLVFKTGENREGAGGLGRKRNLYQFNENRYTSIGIQIIGQKLSAVLVNLKNEVIAEFNQELDFNFWCDDTYAKLELVKNYFVEQAEKTNSEITGIGIAIDGAINIEKEEIRLKISDIEQMVYNYKPFLDKFEQILNMPIYIENDVNASVLCEFENLTVAKPNDLLEISLGDGIGAGLILNKKLYRGSRSGMGEIQYICFDSEYIRKPQSVGWLESKLNIKYLERRYNIDFSQMENVSNKTKQECVRYVAKYLALILCNSVSMLDISNVILSGNVIKALEKDIVENVLDYVKKYTDFDLNIVVSEIEKSSAIGVGILSLDYRLNKVLFS